MSANKRKSSEGLPQGQPDSLNMPTFETAISELENIVHELERDDLTLENALVNFERGIYLMRACDTRLNQVRGRIIQLLKGENGEFVEKVLGPSLEAFLDEQKIQ